MKIPKGLVICMASLVDKVLSVWDMRLGLVMGGVLRRSRVASW